MKINPRPHQFFVKIRFNQPDLDSPLALGFVREPKDFLPTELPALLVKRLTAFLLGTYPVPPAYLEPLIPPGEAAGARRAFQQLLAQGFAPGEAILELGILTKKEWSNVPQTCFAEVLKAGCNCIPLSIGDTGLIASSAGERLAGANRIVRCGEFLTRVEAPPAA